MIPLGRDEPVLIDMLVRTSLGARVEGQPRPLPLGVLRGIMPSFGGGSSEEVPHGRIYVMLEIRRNNAQVLRPWAGYLHAGSPSCFPNVELRAGDVAVISATQTSRGSAIVVGLNLVVDVEPPRGDLGGAGTFFWEAPGSGPGELVSVSLGNPAPGANFATITMPTATRSRVLSLFAQITTDATVATRRLRVQFDDGSSTFGLGYDATGHPASTTDGGVFFAIGLDIGGFAGSRTTAPLPDISMSGSPWRITFATDGLQAADDYSFGQMLVEEWAIP